MSGLAHVTLPDCDDEAFIRGGEHGLIIAADTASVSEKGHFTNYPSNETTTALQIPIVGGRLPPHIVLHKGPCKEHELQPLK